MTQPTWTAVDTSAELITITPEELLDTLRGEIEGYTPKQATEALVYLRNYSTLVYGEKNEDVPLSLMSQIRTLEGQWIDRM